MHFHFLGLFTDSLKSYFDASLLGKAQEAGVIKVHFHNLRDWGVGKHRVVDDRVYGGGAGMVFLPEVVCAAVRELKEKYQIDHVVLTSPRGKKLASSTAKNLSEKKSVLFLCGRYEGVDQRAIDLVVDEEISIGDYILSGGELAAAVIADSVARFVPGVVGKEDSVVFDSFENGLLEYPHYTRPESFEGLSVPEVLLSGDHGKIEKWREEKSLEITKERRPDLIK